MEVSEDNENMNGEEGKKEFVQGEFLEAVDRRYKKGVTVEEVLKWVKGKSPEPPLKTKKEAEKKPGT